MSALVPSPRRRPKTQAALTTPLLACIEGTAARAWPAKSELPRTFCRVLTKTVMESSPPRRARRWRELWPKDKLSTGAWGPARTRRHVSSSLFPLGFGREFHTASPCATRETIKMTTRRAHFSPPLAARPAEEGRQHYQRRPRGPQAQEVRQRRCSCHCVPFRRISRRRRPQAMLSPPCVCLLTVPSHLPLLTSLSRPGAPTTASS